LFVNHYLSLLIPIAYSLSIRFLPYQESTARTRAAATRATVDVLGLTNEQIETAEKLGADNGDNNDDSESDGVGVGITAVRGCVEAIRRRAACIEEHIALADTERVGLQAKLADYADALAAAAASDTSAAAVAADGDGCKKKHGSVMLDAVASQPAEAARRVVALQTAVADISRHISTQRAALVAVKVQQTALEARFQALDVDDHDDDNEKDGDGAEDAPILNAAEVVLLRSAHDAEAAHMIEAVTTARARMQSLMTERAAAQRSIDKLSEEKQIIKRSMNLSR
jgi:hypothetical protein